MHPPQHPHPQPAPRPKSRTGCVIATIIGVVAVFLVGAVSCGAILSGSGPADSPASAPADRTGGGEPSSKPTHKPSRKSAPKVTIRVWGDAPAGVDVMYGSDSDNRQKGAGDLPWETTMTRKSGAMWYSVDAQLNGGGDIHCSVTIGGHTVKGHASGEYQVCSAQVDAPLGGWN